MDEKNKLLSKIQQNRNMNAGFAGICIAFFLALLSSNQLEEMPLSLLFSSICFAIALPIFAATATAMIVLLAQQQVVIESFTSNKVFKYLSFFSRIIFFLAFIFMAFHFSYWVGCFMLISSILPTFYFRQIRMLNDNIADLKTGK